ncbi:MAG: D-tyrosyl-tRNA(Tyr) deacylase [Candidatus Omnitrophica bacterium]|nr:D-tyrosyl-tRNA(Tyr) deacylase [Candidatus Omnitrophota bacterium]
MQVVIQRVDKAEVTVNNEKSESIDQGLVVLVGFEKTDNENNVEKAAQKIMALRIFEDDAGKMNRAITDINGALLVVPNFTLAADCNKGNRPSFDTSLPPREAQILFERLIATLKQSALTIVTGSFGATMKVSLTNNGPVTFTVRF